MLQKLKDGISKSCTKRAINMHKIANNGGVYGKAVLIVLKSVFLFWHRDWLS